MISKDAFLLISSSLIPKTLIRRKAGWTLKAQWQPNSDIMECTRSLPRCGTNHVRLSYLLSWWGNRHSLPGPKPPHGGKHY